MMRSQIRVPSRRWASSPRLRQKGKQQDLRPEPVKGTCRLGLFLVHAELESAQRPSEAEKGSGGTGGSRCHRGWPA